MTDRLEGTNQLNEIIFQDDVDSFPLRDNHEKITTVVAAHALSIESLESGGSPPASSSAEVIAARDEAADLQTRLRDSFKASHAGIFASILNDCQVNASGTPDDKVVVDTGQGLVNGALFRETSTQTLDPANFGVGETNPRIDVVYISADGTAGVTTGTPAATPLPEQIPANTVELAKLYLYPAGGDPNPPKPIKNFEDNATNSFIILNVDRFLNAAGRHRVDRRATNAVLNGAFLVLDENANVWNWTATNAAIVQDSDSLFGTKAAKITNDGSNSQHYASQAILTPTAFRGEYVTVTAYIKLDTAPAATAIQATVEVVQTGDAPAADFHDDFTINDKEWHRIVLQGWIDNEVTAIELRVYPDGDASQVSTTAVLVDGVQMHVGLDVLGFEFPETLKYDQNGETRVNEIHLAVGEIDIVSWIAL